MNLLDLAAIVLAIAALVKSVQSTREVTRVKEQMVLLKVELRDALKRAD